MKTRHGAARENITVLGVCNAAGTVLDPLIIFKGKNKLSSWYGDKALPNTWYGRSTNGMYILVANEGSACNALLLFHLILAPVIILLLSHAHFILVCYGIDTGMFGLYTL